MTSPLARVGSQHPVVLVFYAPVASPFVRAQDFTRVDPPATVVPVDEPTILTQAVVEAARAHPGRALGMVAVLDRSATAPPPPASDDDDAVERLLAQADADFEATSLQVATVVSACEEARRLGVSVDGLYLWSDGPIDGKLPSLAELPANVDVGIGHWTPAELAGRLHRAWCGRRLSAEYLSDMAPLRHDYRVALDRHRQGHERRSLSIDPAFTDLTHKERLMHDLLVAGGPSPRPVDGMPHELDGTEQRVVSLRSDPAPYGQPNSLSLLTHRGAADAPRVTVILDTEHAFCLPAPRRIARWRGGPRLTPEPSLFTAHGDLLEQNTGAAFAETVASLTAGEVPGRTLAVWWSPRNALLAFRFVERLLDLREFATRGERLAVVCTRPSGLLSSQRRYLDKLADGGVIIAASPRGEHRSRVSRTCAWQLGNLWDAVEAQATVAST